MQKKFLFGILMLTVLIQPVLSQTKSESWYRNYLERHIEDLDPIEGIYSVVSKVTYTHGVTESRDFNGKVCIFRSHYSRSNNYRIVQLNGDDVCSDIKLRRVGETNVYNITKYWDGCSETSTGRIYLNNFFSFDFQHEAPRCFVRISEKRRIGTDRYAAYVKIKIQCELVKEYPTRSMYEEAIANAQRKIEEESQPSEWAGTGWAIGNGYLVTNNHVAEGARSITVKGVGGDFNVGYSTEVVATDKINDIAILRINDSRFSGFGSIPYSVTSRMADVGEDVFVLGYPLGQLLGDEIKLTTGIINSRTGAGNYQNCYQIQAPITNGNSGGPVFDSKGNVIGIVVAGLNKELNLAENVGYAIKTSYLKILIESIGLNITFPSNNTISTLSRPEKVKRVKNFVYYIECSR